MDRLCIVGGKPLSGEVTLGGSKNGALPILAATLLIDDDVVLHNVPHISDIEKMSNLLSLLGVNITRHGHALHVNAAHLTTARADRDLTATMRASFYVLGPLLARLHQAEVPLPGGCAIGKRPVDYVMRALSALGVQTEETPDVVYCRAPAGLHGATITLDPNYRSPGATFNVTMAACLANGCTVIENASADPEVESFCRFLQAAGATIEGAGTTRLVIEGCRRLHACEHTILSDRIEAGTFLMAGAATRGCVRVSPIPPRYLTALLDALTDMGFQVRYEENAVTVCATGQSRGTTITTAPYPGFPTDLQPPMVVLLCLAEGRSIMNEGIYDGRLNFIHELDRLGAQIRLSSRQQAVIEGVSSLTGGSVEATDMRAGAALTLAALAASGESVVTGRQYIRRGYERFEDKLAALGARITTGGKTIVA